ncbi:MAG: hypothetical protein ACI83P_000239 [Janthinobacterium sp.]|jgi:hypothetical protein
MFVIIMANIGVWGFSGARFAHQLEHNGIKQAVAHQHVAVVDYDASVDSNYNDDDDDRTPGSAAHQVLHAVDHLQFFPDTALGGAFAPAKASVMLLHFTEQALPLPTLDPLFRPPRSHTG